MTATTCNHLQLSGRTYLLCPDVGPPRSCSPICAPRPRYYTPDALAERIGGHAVELLFGCFLV
jgi:hypothetical protein